MLYAVLHHQVCRLTRLETKAGAGASREEKAEKEQASTEKELEKTEKEPEETEKAQASREKEQRVRLGVRGSGIARAKEKLRLHPPSPPPTHRSAITHRYLHTGHIRRQRLGAASGRPVQSAETGLAPNRKPPTLPATVRSVITSRVVRITYPRVHRDTGPCAGTPYEVSCTRIHLQTLSNDQTNVSRWPTAPAEACYMPSAVDIHQAPGPPGATGTRTSRRRT